MEFTSLQGEQRYAALVRAAPGALVGLDFDGTLAPIVDDPEQARIHPEAAAILADLAEQVLGVAVITGRPARQALDLGLDVVGDDVAAAGKDLYLFGQYGNERWQNSGTGRIVGPRPPPGLASFERELTRTLQRAEAAGAFVEDKGLAVAVHTRRLGDAEAAFARLLPALRDLAARHDLVVEPGRSVIEIRSPGVHKGTAVTTLVEELDVEGFLFAGDDLGDLEAFEAVRDLARDGVATLLVCSSSEEENALQPLADVVVDGPQGVLELLAQLAEDARNTRA
ncbi:MAG: trehalose-phosphatase [Nocardioides sp.]